MFSFVSARHPSWWVNEEQLGQRTLPTIPIDAFRPHRIATQYPLYREDKCFETNDENRLICVTRNTTPNVTHGNQYAQYNIPRIGFFLCCLHLLKAKEVEEARLMIGDSVVWRKCFDSLKKQDIQDIGYATWLPHVAFKHMPLTLVIKKASCSKIFPTLQFNAILVPPDIFHKYADPDRFIYVPNYNLICYQGNVI